MYIHITVTGRNKAMWWGRGGGVVLRCAARILATLSQDDTLYDEMKTSEDFQGLDMNSKNEDFDVGGA